MSGVSAEVWSNLSNRVRDAIRKACRACSEKCDCCNVWQCKHAKEIVEDEKT